jgi:hypothetical protein
MTTCGVEAFLLHRGPAVVPLRACCAAALLHASNAAFRVDPTPFVCATGMDDVPIGATPDVLPPRTTESRVA